jgi:NodT family efflux transporter outer membrane factor (OMF) lipoprotein
MKLRQAALIAAACGALAACVDSSGLAPRATLEDANRLASARSLAAAGVGDSAWPDTEWWKGYGDPQLDGLVTRAFAGNPTLRIARARLDQANAFVAFADANRGAQLTGSAEVTRQRFSANGFFPPPLAGSYETTGQILLDFRYELDFWGRNRAALEAALSRAAAAEVDTRAARLFLATAVARTYVELDRQFRQLEVLRSTLEQRRQILRLTEGRVRAGLDSNVELRQAASAVPSAEVDVAAAEGRIALLRNQLAALAGGGPDDGLRIERPSLGAGPGLALPALLPADLLGRRPDVVAERLRVEAAARDIDLAKAEFYPNVNLAGFAGLNALELSKLLQAPSAVLAFGPALHLPVFDAGRLRANLSARDADYDAAVEQYNATLVDALRDVADQVAAWRSLDAQQVQQRTAQTEVEEAYRLALLRYREGLSNYLTVLTTEAQVLAERRRQVDLRAGMLEVSVNLARALGGGYRPAPELPIGSGAQSHGGSS